MARNSATHTMTEAGMGDILAFLQNAPRHIRATHLAAALEAGGKPILRRMKQLVPKRTGALHKSLSYKVAKRESKGTAINMIGPRRDYYKGGKKLKKSDDRRGADKPANYAHLVEFGHYSGTSSEGFKGYAKGDRRRRGSKLKPESELASRDKSFVLPKPFIRPALLGERVSSEREIRRVLSGALAKLARESSRHG